MLEIRKNAKCYGTAKRFLRKPSIAFLWGFVNLKFIAETKFCQELFSPKNHCEILFALEGGDVLIFWSNLISACEAPWTFKCISFGCFFIIYIFYGAISYCELLFVRFGEIFIQNYVFSIRWCSLSFQMHIT